MRLHVLKRHLGWWAKPWRPDGDLPTLRRCPDPFTGRIKDQRSSKDATNSCGNTKKRSSRGCALCEGAISMCNHDEVSKYKE